MCYLIALVAATLVGGTAPPHGDQPDEAPPIRWPKVVASARDAAGFAPAGWTVEASAVGDFDGDGVPDLVEILHDRAPVNVLHNAEVSTEGRDTNPRLLLVALGQRGGPFRLLTANRTLIPRWTDWNLDDPLGDVSGLSVKRRAFTVPLHLFANAGGWGAFERSLTFRVVDGQVVLIGFDEEYLQRNTGRTTSTSIDYLTRAKVVTEDSIDGKAPRRVRRTRLPQQALLTIEQVQDGMELQPK